MDSRRIGWMLLVMMTSVLLITTWSAVAAQPGALAQVTPPVSTGTPAPTSEWPKMLPLDDIFPPSDARDLVLENCTVCHSFVRIVMSQRTEQLWNSVMYRHIGRTGSLSYDKFAAIFDYLKENFNDTKPVPRIPDWMPDFIW